MKPKYKIGQKLILEDNEHFEHKVHCTITECASAASTFYYKTNLKPVTYFREDLFSEGVSII